MKLRGADVSFEVVLPRHPELAKLFRNANWAHFLAPEQNPPSQFRGFTQVLKRVRRVSDLPLQVPTAPTDRIGALYNHVRKELYEFSSALSRSSPPLLPKSDPVILN